MGTTADKLNKILQTKEEIKQAIISKGVNVSDEDTFASYSEKISSIQAGSDEKFMLVTDNNTRYNNLFRQKSSLQGDIDLSHWDVSAVTTMEYMFGTDVGITSVNLSNWNTVNLKDTGNMFSYCSKMIDVNLENWDASSLTHIAAMFTNCSSLISVDLSSWTSAPNIISLGSLFNGCTSLETVNISCLYLYEKNITSSSFYSSIFKNCSKLTNLNPPAVIEVPLDLSPCILLTHESLLSVLNNLSTITTTKTLTLGATNLAKLTDDEKAIATNKGWTLA